VDVQNVSGPVEKRQEGKTRIGRVAAEAFLAVLKVGEDSN
jgi:hypothetical protein